MCLKSVETIVDSLGAAGLLLAFVWEKEVITQSLPIHIDGALNEAS